MDKFRQAFSQDLGAELDQAELRGFARSVSEIEWLLLVMAAIYLIAPGTQVEGRGLAVGVCAVFGLVSLIFRFLPALRRQTRLKIAAQTLFMLAFTTAFIMSIDQKGGHLLSLYLLPVIVSALTLGRWMTLAVVVLASVGFISASLFHLPPGSIHVGMILELGVNLAPFLLVAMVTSMLAYEMAIARSRIRTLSETDALTGLYNVRVFSRILKQEHGRAVRHRRNYAVLAIDIDRLKRINDTYGHDVGNRVIILVANVIARLIRTTDAAARFGGDEFVVLLSETDLESAKIVAKRIAHTVGRATIEASGAMVKPRVSVGAASFPEDGEEPRDLMVKADHAMYREKEAARNDAPGEPEG